MRTLALVLLSLLVGCAETPAPKSVAGARAPAMELTVLGSGGPHSFGRAASSYVVSLEGVPRVLVDAGPGAFVRLGETGLDLARLDTILLTHLHVDHAGDLPGVVKSRDLTYSQALTFRIFGPDARGPYPATSSFVQSLFGDRGAFAYLPSFRNELDLDVHDLRSADPNVQSAIGDPDLHVTAIAVDHADVPAVAYRIEHAGRSVVITGDLASKDDHLIRLAEDADLVVYDTTLLDGAESVLNDYHTTPKRIGEVAAAAHVRGLLLGHLSKAAFESRERVIASIHASYAGPVRLAEDRLRVPIGGR